MSKNHTWMDSYLDSIRRIQIIFTVVLRFRKIRICIVQITRPLQEWKTPRIYYFIEMYSEFKARKMYCLKGKFIQLLLQWYWLTLVHFILLLKTWYLDGAVQKELLCFRLYFRNSKAENVWILKILASFVRCLACFPLLFPSPLPIDLRGELMDITTQQKKGTFKG